MVKYEKSNSPNFLFLEITKLYSRIKNANNTNTSEMSIPNTLGVKLGGTNNEDKIKNPTIETLFLIKWARQDSNLRPTDYESVALTN